MQRWYHCLELAPGVVTPGWFDVAAVADALPWPDVAGKRCLDIGTSDGFFAFELERRGASEVVAIEIGSHEDWDWEVHMGELGPQYLRHVVGEVMSRGFEAAHRALESKVRLERSAVYDLSPDGFGEFDVVVCGSLLLHLRDPLRALAAIRSVCRGEFLCTNQMDLVRSVLCPRRPLIRLDGTSGLTQWWLPNAAGHRQMLRAAGFAPLRDSGLYSIPYGPAHPRRSLRPRSLARSVARRLLTGNDGVTHYAVLAEPVQRTGAR